MTVRYHGSDEFVKADLWCPQAKAVTGATRRFVMERVLQREHGQGEPAQLAE